MWPVHVSSQPLQELEGRSGGGEEGEEGEEWRVGQGVSLSALAAVL